MRRLAVAGLIFLGVAGGASAEDAAKDPIDTALDACLGSDDGQSTAGMVQCYDAAYKSWDAELNKAYQSLSVSLDPKSRGLLRRSQRQWVAFRDAEKAFWNAPWTADRGSLMTVTLNAEVTEMVKARVLQLRDYVEP